MRISEIVPLCASRNIARTILSDTAKAGSLFRAAVLAAGLLGASATAVLAAPEAGCPVRQVKGQGSDTQPAKSSESYWQARMLQQEQEIARTDLARVRLVMLGDSLIEGWAPPVQQLFYGHRGMLNLGIGGDSTQGALWRIQRLRQTGLQPQLFVLLIGTNNIWPAKAPEDVAAGVAEVVRQVREWSPQSRVLLLGLLPRGNDANDPLRTIQQQVNQMISRCADGNAVFYADPGALLLDAGGRIPDKIMPDKLHPNWIGR
eukprot:gene6019-6092_t